jgi:hypothetical protein
LVLWEDLFPARSVFPSSPVVGSLLIPASPFTLPTTYIRPTFSPMSTEHNYDVPSFPISHRNSVEGSGHVAHANTALYEELYKESIQDPTGFWDKVRLCPQNQEVEAGTTFPRSLRARYECGWAEKDASTAGDGRQRGTKSSGVVAGEERRTSRELGRSTGLRSCSLPLCRRRWGAQGASWVAQQRSGRIEQLQQRCYSLRSSRDPFRAMRG